MKSRFAALSAVPLLLLLSACGSVAENAANDAASKVATVASDGVKKQVCTLAEDGLVSVQDKALLGGLVSAATVPACPRKLRRRWARSPRPETKCRQSQSQN
ncbi:UNVERIFIED_ORG: hypothetical protein ABID57_003462 [Arthrobacter sp. UYEF1]